jgi:hypothetical protein
MWFLTQVVVLFENLKQMPQVGMFSSFLIMYRFRSEGVLGVEIGVEICSELVDPKK